MKKSLLKRAIASAVAVPLALTQCLAPVFAADDLTTLSAADSQTKAITLSSITNVAVDAPIEADGYQHSSWNKTVAAALLSLDDVQYTPDTTALFESITNASGKYKEQVAAVLANVRDTKVTYDSLGTTVTVSGTLDDISSVVVDQIKNNINNTLEGLSGKYGEDVLANFKDISIDCPEISGTVKIVADLSTIGATRSGSVDGVFIAEDGTEYKLGGENSIFDYADEKLPAIKESLLKAVIKAENAANAVSGDNSGSEVADTISKTIKKWTGRVNTAKLKLEAGKTTSKSVSGENLADVLAQVKAKYPKYSKRLPSSAADAASKPRVQKAFNGAINQLNKLISSKGYSVDISLEEAALAADSLYDINAALNNGVVTFSAKMAEDQMAELESYYAGLNKEVVSSYKVVNITADYAALYSGAGNFSLDIYRVIETKDKEPIVTTTTPQGSVTTTATATTPQGGSTTTATATTPQGGSTTTATATTPQGGSTTTVTVTTSQGGSTTTTTLQTLKFKDCFINNEATDFTSTVGYYFSHDTNSFNKDQVVKLMVTLVLDNGAIIENVDLLDQEAVNAKLIEAGAEPATIDITFGDATPATVFNKSTNKYDVQLYVNGTPLTSSEELGTDEAGNPIYKPMTVTAYIGVKGDADLNNTVDANDASNILTYYAQKQTGVANPVLYSAEDENLEQLACFLADTDKDVYSEGNWNTDKANRNLDANDASNILTFYSYVQTGSSDAKNNWDTIIG
ncbi:MAG TPA: cellulose-binding protein CttA-related protein [Ruminococcus sp.]